MKIKFDRIISIATLTTSVVALILVLKKPTPVAAPLPAPAVAASAQSFQNKIDQLAQAQAQGQSGAEVRLNAHLPRRAAPRAAQVVRFPAISVPGTPASRITR
jgi:hypothetical protein